MATTTPKPAKNLGELLQEQQEPFILDIYLSERGYLKKSLSSNGNFACGHANSSRSLKMSGSLNKSRKGIPHYSKILKTVCDKLISINKRLRVKNSDNRDGKVGDVGVTEMGKNYQEVAEADRFSSASSTTVFNSCSESDAEETSNSLQKDDHVTFTADTHSLKHCSNPRGKEVASDRKLQCRCMEDNRQLSPVSVLEEIPSHGDSPLHNTQQEFGRTQEENPTKTSVHCPRKVTEDSILSASLWKLLFHSAAEKPNHAGVAELQELVKYYSSSQCLKSKRVLHQTKQLLFDFVREVIATQERKEMKQQQQCKEFLVSEELGKLICEKINAWEKQPGDESNIMQLLDLDMLDSAQEWSDFGQQKTDIGLEIGDAIFKKIINELVIDKMNIFGTD